MIRVETKITPMMVSPASGLMSNGRFPAVSRQFPAVRDPSALRRKCSRAPVDGPDSERFDIAYSSTPGSSGALQLCCRADRRASPLGVRPGGSIANSISVRRGKGGPCRRKALAADIYAEHRVGGEFWMGDDKFYPDEGPVYAAWVEPFSSRYIWRRTNSLSIRRRDGLPHHGRATVTSGGISRHVCGRASARGARFSSNAGPSATGQLESVVGFALGASWHLRGPTVPSETRQPTWSFRCRTRTHRRTPWRANAFPPRRNGSSQPGGPNRPSPGAMSRSRTAR